MGMTEDARQKAIAKAITAINEPGVKSQSVKIPEYRDGKEGPFPVIDIPVEAAVYNPRSHRIRAQLEGHPKGQVIQDDPFSDEAQNAIAEILRQTSNYVALKDEIGASGQKYWGIVTSAGLLVNANTRLAALRELDHTHIMVAVLPSTATDADIRKLELELQVQRDWRQDYTFTNELLFIAELIKDGQKASRIADSMNEPADHVDKCLRMLANVREIQQMGKKIRLEWFDDQKQSLEDLDTRLQRLRAISPGAVEPEKQKGFFVLLLKLGYSPMRGILKDGVVEDELLPRIAEIGGIGPRLAAIIEDGEAAIPAPEDDGTSLLGDDEDADGRITLAPMNRILAESFGDNKVSITDGAKTLSKDRGDLVAELEKALETSIEAERLTAKQTKKLDTPVAQLRDAVKKAKSAYESFAKAQGEPGFQEGGFGYQLRKLKKEVERLESLTAPKDQKQLGKSE